MSNYEDFKVGQRVKVNKFYGDLRKDVNPLGTVAVIDPESTSWPIEVKMDDEWEWGSFTAPFDPEELDIVSEG